MESIFCLLLVVEEFFLQKVVEMLEEVVVSWWEIGWIWQMRQNFVVQFIQLLKCQLCVVVRCFHGEELGPFCWPMSAVGTAVFRTAYNLLSTLFRCNGFAGTQKAIMVKEQTIKQWPQPFSDAGLTLGSALELLSPTIELVTTSFCIKSTLHCTSQSEKWFTVVMQNKRKWHFKMKTSLIFSQLMRYPLIELFHLSNLLQMPNDYRMINTEFFCNFLCSC